MHYKPSFYNIIFREGKTTFIFNTRLSSYLKINRPLEENFSWESVPKALKPHFIEGGFVIPVNLTELSLLQLQNRIACFDFTKLSLTIVPTMHCNMKCVYCFEKHRPENMTKSVSDSIISFVDAKVKKGVKAVDVTFFGGEPLMNYKLLCELSEKIQEVCRKNGSQCWFSLISNGTLLTKEKSEELKKLGFSDVQITMDGPQSIHDKRRPYLKGGGTFDKIIKNVEEALPFLSVSIRCNIDRFNVQNVKGLVDELAKRGINKQVSIGFAPVHEFGGLCGSNELPCGSMFSSKEFSLIENELKDYALEKDFRVAIIPSPRSCPCSATRAHSFVIEPNGNIQKCWAFVGCEKEKIGSVFDGIEFTDNALKWLTCDPFKNEDCRICKILPICMGWCPHDLFYKKVPEVCSTLKFNIIDVLKRFYKCNQNAQIERR